jgi:hypothetical protein
MVGSGVSSPFGSSVFCKSIRRGSSFGIAFFIPGPAKPAGTAHGRFNMKTYPR